MSLATKYQTELLAPAGSIESFFAAMEAGADAVYCGLKDFSARSKAKNFTLAEMENLSAYAHKLGRKIYIPLNTLIKESELPHLINVLEGIAHCQIDGLIIQDLGVYNLVQHFFPEIPLHASTQMAVHNSAGVQMLERLGFERAVLARELSLDEIKTIRNNTTIELEHFIHGALCYSVSGHCLFSSFQTGNSGNRGGCSQPCRRKYSQGDTSQFTFSTSDFSTLPLLPQLAKSGVMSFKIEGRMKNSEYVWNVVRAYREVLDCHEADMAQAIRTGETILKESHGRQTTSGFLTGKRTTILLPQQKGGIGTPAGQVERVSGKYISFTSQTNLHIGDKLRIQPQTDQPGISFTIREIQTGKKKQKQVKQGQTVTIQTPFHERFSADDHIFKISTGRGFTLSEEACRRRLSTATTSQTKLDLFISCTTTSMEVEMRSPFLFKQTYEIESFTAQKSPLSTEALINIFKKTAHPELQLGHLQTASLPAIVIKPSKLKAIRREFYAQVYQEVTKQSAQRAEQRHKQISAELAETGTNLISDSAKLLVYADAPHGDLIKNEDISIILPLTAEAKHLGHTCIWDIPAIIYDDEWPAVKQRIKQKRELGATRFRLNNISHFILFDQPETVELMAGTTLYCLNQQAFRALEDLHISQITSSLEDDKVNVTALSHYQSGIIVQVYGYAPLMISRIPLSSAENIKTQQQTELSPKYNQGLTEIQSTTPFSISGRLSELRDQGIHHFLVDLRGHIKQQRTSIIQAVERDQTIIGCSDFNFDRGLA